LRGPRGRFKHLFNEELFWEHSRVVATSEPDSRRQFRAAFATRYDHQGRFLESAIRNETELELFRAGSNITFVVYGIEAIHRPLGQLVDSLRKALNLAGKGMVAAFFSPGSAGFETHLDSANVFVLQIAGSKKWRVSLEPGLRAPRSRLMLQGSSLPDV